MEGGVHIIITLEQAKKALQASESKASELGIKVTTSVVDKYGVVIATSRMDQAIPVSTKFAYAKAFTAAAFGMSTKDIAPYAVEGKPYYGIASLSNGEITTITGGVAILQDGEIIGGIGVGGSTDTAEDELCANEALKAIQ